jgi:hypothetical protein
VRPDIVPDVPAGRVTPVTCPVIVGVAEKLYPVIVAPPLVGGGTKEIPIEVGVREVTASVPGVDKSVTTSIVAGAVSAKGLLVAGNPLLPTIDRLYFVPGNKVVGLVMAKLCSLGLLRI